MEFFEMFDGNLPALAVIGFVMLVCAIVPSLISNGYLSRMLKGRGKGKTLAELAGRMDEVEKGFVHGLDGTLERIEGKLDSMRGSMADLERRINYVDKSALMAVIYNGDVHVIDRLRAFVHYLKLGGNGTVLEYAYGELVKPNRREWTRALDESRMKIHCEKYRKKIAEIDRRLKNGKAD